MQTTMPLMFGFFSLSFPSGLSIYFVLSNLIGIAQGYYMRYVTGKEKAEAAEEKKRGKKKGAVVIADPVPSSADLAVVEAVDGTVEPASSSKKPAPSSKKTKSKRKRRSKKR